MQKIRALQHKIAVRDLSVAIEVDGGVAPDNAAAICEAGADILVAGSAIFGQPDYVRAIEALRSQR
jgi:ribulose-phosphate 3-epimerase